MQPPFFDLGRQAEELGEAVARHLDHLFRHQRFITGEEVRKVEHTASGPVGGGRAMACASATDALVIEALEASEGDEVVLPAFTCSATVGAARNDGVTPARWVEDDEPFDIRASTIEPRLVNGSKKIAGSVVAAGAFPLLPTEIRVAPATEVWPGRPTRSWRSVARSGVRRAGVGRIGTRRSEQAPDPILLRLPYGSPG